MNRAANALKELGVRRGDRVAIYMPMIPELPVAMLACARIGAPHTVVFGGFSAEALADRINDSQAKLVITADGGYRRGKASGLKVNVDDAVSQTPSIEHVLVVQRTGQDVTMVEDRDVWWHDVVPRQPEWCEPERMESEDMLYLLYTSGTTAKPKGILHTTGGYLTGITSTHRSVFDIKDNDVFWLAADIGWVTGHSYIVYAPLANHTTGVMYEGTPDWPDPSRWWDIVERYGVTVVYMAPTAIRAHMKWGPQYAEQHDLNVACDFWEPSASQSIQKPGSGTTSTSGGGRCPIVDTWWQTETGGIMISPVARKHDDQAGLGHQADPRHRCRRRRRLRVTQCRWVKVDTSCSEQPWPSMLRGDLWRPRALTRRPLLEASSRGCRLSPGTVRAATRMATTG